VRIQEVEGLALLRMLVQLRLLWREREMVSISSAFSIRMFDF
jgi:hypothetical protein